MHFKGCMISTAIGISECCLIATGIVNRNNRSACAIAPVYPVGTGIHNCQVYGMSFAGLCYTALNIGQWGQRIYIYIHRGAAAAAVCCNVKCYMIGSGNGTCNMNGRLTIGCSNIIGVNHCPVILYGTTLITI